MADHARKPGPIYRRRKSLGDVWRWAQGHGPHRWRLCLHWAQDHERQLRNKARRLRKKGNLPHDTEAELRRQEARWDSAKHVYAKRLAAAKKHHHQRGGQPKFERYMLNGHPGNVVPAVERGIARMAVETDGYVTATTDGTHATGSYHYPRNNPDPATRAKNLGRAFDTGGPEDTGWLAHFRNELKRGAQYFMELFGPPSGYVKNGVYSSGGSPDVPNHCHDAPELSA